MGDSFFLQELIKTPQSSKQARFSSPSYSSFDGVELPYYYNNQFMPNGL